MKKYEQDELDKIKDHKPMKVTVRFWDGLEGSTKHLSIDYSTFLKLKSIIIEEAKN